MYVLRTIVGHEESERLPETIGNFAKSHWQKSEAQRASEPRKAELLHRDPFKRELVVRSDNSVDIFLHRP